MEKEIVLPKPKEKGDISFEEILNRRRSVREYEKGFLRLSDISQLLWAASGRNLYRRTAPSAGATYPLEIYLVAGEVEGLKSGLYRYSYPRHSLIGKNEEDLRRRLALAALEQRMIERAPATVILTADYSRTTGRYGPRGTRYVHMETGHVGQNISLQAISLGLGTVMIGAFDDHEVKHILGIEEEPVYMIPIGRAG